MSLVIKMEFANNVKDLSGSAIRETFKLLSQPGIISFAGGMPAPELFPGKELAEISRDILENNGSVALQYGITEGYAPLVEQIRQRLGDKIKQCDSVITTAGGQGGIYLTAKILLDPGDGVVCESPSFVGALNCFRAFNAKLFGVELQEDGMDMTQLEQVLSTQKIKFIYTIPNFQNPTGITASLEKRKKLLELADKYDVLILEDDPYGELRFAGEDITSLKELDDKGRVIYAGSFSKILSPGLRVGFICADAVLVEKMSVCKQVVDVHTSVLPQMIASEFMNRYSMTEHVEKQKALYKEKCEFMLTCVDKYLPVKTTRPEGGLFLWCWGDGETNCLDVYKKAVEQKVAFVPGNTLMPDMTVKTSAFRLNYSTAGFDNIEKGMKILGEVLNG